MTIFQCSFSLKREQSAEDVITRLIAFIPAAGQTLARNRGLVGRAVLVFLLGFAFANRDDLEIIADRFQNKCFVNRAGQICRAVA